MTRITVNNYEYSVEVSDDMPLLWYLRDHLNLTGTKYGCGEGLCGACTVHIEGNSVRSCQVTMSEVIGKSVTTIEALSATGLHPLQQAWIDVGVPQCGYCQSGQLMSAAALLTQIPNPSDDEINHAMAGNICRCGTYNRIKAAIHKAANQEQDNLKTT